MRLPNLQDLTSRWRPSPGAPGIDALVAHADPRAAFEDRLRWLAGVMQWVSGSRRILSLGSPSITSLPEARLRYLLQLLDRNPEWKTRVARTFRSIVRDADALELLCEAGLPADRGFLTEAFDRFAQWLTPTNPWRAELGSALTAVFPSPEDAAWLERLTPETVDRLGQLVLHDEADDEAGWNDFARDGLDALLILVSDIRLIGLSTPVRKRLGSVRFRELPFFGLTRAAEDVAAAARGERDADLDAAIGRLRELLARCEAAGQEVFRHLDEFGVSVRVVFLVERMHAQIRRVRSVLELAAVGRPRSERLPPFLASLVRDSHARLSLQLLARQNLHLLARKLVERSAETGEHYIARDRAEYRAMLKAASGGGVVAALVTWIKIGLHGLHLAPLAEGLLASLNYAAGFVTIQLAHFTLATKQPATTAPALAARLNELDRPAGLQAFTDEAVHLLRSQAASIVGNLALTVPVALLVDVVAKVTVGHSLLGVETATKTIASLSILGPSLLYAGLTGVFLWLSALAAAWSENWFVLRRVGDGLAHSPLLRAFLGRRGAERVSSYAGENVAGLTGNVLLGFLLGFVPSLFAALGLPVEIRHVTIAAGQLTAGASALGAAALRNGSFWLGVAGVLAIGAVNVIVSFFLALSLAVRARGVAAPERSALRRALGRRLVEKPLSFLYPVETARPRPEAPGSSPA
jgi:site-specific recombinase